MLIGSAVAVILLPFVTCVVDPGWDRVGSYSEVARDTFWFGFVNPTPHDLITIDTESFSYTNFCTQYLQEGFTGTPPWTDPFKTLYSQNLTFTHSVNSSLEPYMSRAYFLKYKYIASEQRFFNPASNSFVYHYVEPALEGWNWYSDLDDISTIFEPGSSYRRRAAKKWEFSVRVVTEPYGEESGEEGGGIGDT